MHGLWEPKSPLQTKKNVFSAGGGEGACSRGGPGSDENLDRVGAEQRWNWFGSGMGHTLRTWVGPILTKNNIPVLTEFH